MGPGRRVAALSKAGAPFEMLDDHLLTSIASHLRARDLGSLAQTCRRCSDATIVEDAARQRCDQLPAFVRAWWPPRCRPDETWMQVLREVR